MATAARYIALAVVAVFAVCVGPASAQSTGIGFSFMPKHVLQGDPARIAVTVRPAGVSCSLKVSYFGGTTQTGLAPTVAAGGRAQWSWTVPTNVQAGLAKATVKCARAGAVTRPLVVIGRLIAPKIIVKQTGFSTRPQAFAGTRLSYGLMLHNESSTQDAKNVMVQTNFVLADGFLLGTDSQRLDWIAAGADYALGNTVSFPGLAPIVRLETVITVGAFAKASLTFPTLANIHLVPQVFDPNWLGTVEGELQNTDPLLILRNAQCTAVVFDAAGNILGGGSGYAFQTLPPGARQALQLGNGFDVIPYNKASSVTVSMTPSWQQPGT
jgi:hypothetical protein